MNPNIAPTSASCPTCQGSGSVPLPKGYGTDGTQHQTLDGLDTPMRVSKIPMGIPWWTIPDTGEFAELRRIAQEQERRRISSARMQKYYRAYGNPMH